MRSSALLIRVTGHDRPGVTHALTSILARYDARVLDIGQAVIHDGLAFGILIELSETLRSSSLLTDLLLEAHRLGVEVKFSASSAEEYEAWVARKRGAASSSRCSVGDYRRPHCGCFGRAGRRRPEHRSHRSPVVAARPQPDDGQPRFCVEFTATSSASAARVTKTRSARD